MILELTQEAAQFLAANPYFADIPVVSVNEKDLSNMVQQYLAKVGIGVIVGTPSLGAPISDIGAGGRGVNFSDIDLRVTVFEIPTVNRSATGTNKWAPSVAEVICVLLHLHKPEGIAESVVCVSGPRLVPRDDLMLVYDNGFRTSGGVEMTSPIQTILTPTVTTVNHGDGTSTVTLACLTAYAQIIYSTDGSYPSPIDSVGTPRAPYTAPFTVATGSPLKVRAYRAGYLASSMVNQNI